MLTGDLEIHTDNANCRAGDMHSFLITSAKTSTLDAAPLEGDQVMMVNDPAGTALLTVDAGSKQIGEFGVTTTVSPGETLLLRYDGTKWLIVLLARVAATPGWHKLDVVYTQVQVDGVTKTVVLVALPINAWIHALAWKAPADWAPAAGEWEEGSLELVLTLRDEDSVKTFLSEGILGTISGGAWVPAALEGGAGQLPQRFSSSVTKNLVAVFEVRTPA